MMTSNALRGVGTAICTVLLLTVAATSLLVTHESPLLPATADTLFQTRYEGGWRTPAADNASLPVRAIPRQVWIGMRTKPNATWRLKEHLQVLANRSMSDGWQFNVLGNAEQLAFMETYWPGTSVLWAYKAVNPSLGNAACGAWAIGRVLPYCGPCPLAVSAPIMAPALLWPLPYCGLCPYCGHCPIAATALLRPLPYCGPRPIVGRRLLASPQDRSPSPLPVTSAPAPPPDLSLTASAPARLGYKIYSVPITYDNRQGESKLSPVADGLKIAWMLIKNLGWQPDTSDTPISGGFEPTVNESLENDFSKTQYKIFR